MAAERRPQGPARSAGPHDSGEAKVGSKGAPDSSVMAVDRVATSAEESPSLPHSGRRTGTKSSPYRGVTLFKPTMKWRAQISAGGKTTSLGDHDTEEDAARAFDRAAINKAGANAKTNFSIADYKEEIADLQAIGQTELVAMLRSRARKSGTQTSHYRGVSLLKQTQKWHAQINVGGKQVHLGFFPSEEQAARAYDRAAINKGARDGGKIITNMDIADYSLELDKLRRISQHELVEALASEVRRKQTMDMLASGSFARGEEIFGSGFDVRPEPFGVSSVSEIHAKAERAQPKPTQANPLYANFGKPREGENGELLPLVTRPPNFPAPVDKPRQLGRPRALFRRRKPSAHSSSGNSSSEEETEDEAEADYEAADHGVQPATRRSARTAGKAIKHYNDASDSDGEGADSREGRSKALHTPERDPATLEWGAASPAFRGASRVRARKAAADSETESEADGRKDRRRKKDELPAPVEPAQPPTRELLAFAVAAARGDQGAAGRADASGAGTSATKVPSADALPGLDSEAGTAGSRATATLLDQTAPAPLVLDTGSQAILRRPSDLADYLSPATVAGNNSSSATPGHPGKRSPALEDQAPGAAGPGGASPQSGRGGSLGEKGSVAMEEMRDKASTLAGVGGPLGDKLSDAGAALPPKQARDPVSVEGALVEEAGDGSRQLEELGKPVTSPAGKRLPPKKGTKRREEAPQDDLLTKRAKTADEESPKPALAKPLTKRQKAMMERQEQRRQGRAPAVVQSDREPSPKSSVAANARPSPRNSVAVNQNPHPKAEARQRLQEDAASQSSPQLRLQRRDRRAVPGASSSDDSHGPAQVSQDGKPGPNSSSEDPGDSAPRREGPNRRKRKQPARSAF